MRTDAVSHADALAPGSQLGEFEVREVLGAGGFGIVYRAFDRILEREVAIKEYMPAHLAGRDWSSNVAVRSSVNAASFDAGRRCFVNEARLLARFDHPSLVKVHRYWEDNGTAYMAMPLYRGRTLKTCILQRGAPPAEACVRATLDKLLGALEVLHAQGVYHRDIAPDNIIVCDDGTPVLLDFGAARRISTDRADALTAVLKPTFAAIEQHTSAGVMPQGAWTDLYSLAAVVRCMLTGNAPVPATARAACDLLAPLATLGLEGYSPALLAAIDWAMAVRPQDRPQSVAAWRQALDGKAPPPAPWRPDEPRRLRSLRTIFRRPRWALTVASDDGAVFDVSKQGPSPVEKTAFRAWFAPLQWAQGASRSLGALADRRKRAATQVLLRMLELRERARMPVSRALALQLRGAALLWLGGCAIALAALWTAFAPKPGAPHEASTLRVAAAMPAIPMPTSLIVEPAAAEVVKEQVPAVPAAAMQPLAAADAVAATQMPPAAAQPESGFASKTGSTKIEQIVPVVAVPAAGAAAVRSDGAARSKTAAAVRSKVASQRTGPALPRRAAIVPLDPRAACDSSFFMMRAWCVDRQCAKPRFAGHSVCERLREESSARHQRRSGRP